ncbi:MAG: hypothetical protein F4145_10830 [Boseongicola sp. SB0675_bin_26]|nr:hypothetical protein [Boseongicola sp. SB0675_bin_26]
MSPEAARPVAEADPLPGDEDEGCVPVDEDREPDPRDVDRPPSEAEEVSARTDDPENPASATKSDGGSGETQEASDRPRAETSAPAGEIDPGAVDIEEGLEPLWPVAGPAPAPDLSGSDDQTEAVPGEVEGAGTWTSVERATFMSLSDAGMSLADIAEELGKSLAAVEAWMAGQSMQGLLPGGVGNVDGGPDEREPDDHGSRGPA